MREFLALRGIRRVPGSRRPVEFRRAHTDFNKSAFSCDGRRVSAEALENAAFEIGEAGSNFVGIRLRESISAREKRSDEKTAKEESAT